METPLENLYFEKVAKIGTHLFFLVIALECDEVLSVPFGHSLLALSKVSLSFTTIPPNNPVVSMTLQKASAASSLFPLL